MRVLVACEESGIVRDAFKQRGHYAVSCDLLPSRRPGLHYQGDAFKALSLELWDLVLMFPDCRYLCGSGWHWNSRRPERAALSASDLKFALRLWTGCKAPRAMLENSIGILSRPENLGKPTQIIQPYNFGENASKSTCLWLRGLPLLKPTRYCKPRLVCKSCGRSNAYAAAFKRGCQHCGAEAGLLVPRWSNQTDSGQNRLGPSPTRSRDRATTYQGVADAFAEQWGNLKP